MILAVDIGNTYIVVGCIRDDEIIFVERLHTDTKKSELEYAISIKTVLEIYGIDRRELDGGILSSAVPPLTSVMRRAAAKVTGREPLVVGPGVKTGLDILFKEEGVEADEVMGHGGLFKTKGVGQSIMAAAMDVPVTVMETAGEGGAWGIALLAAYMREKKDGESLGAYLNNRVFAGEKGETLAPDPEDVKGFDAFLARYTEGLAIEHAAVDHLK